MAVRADGVEVAAHGSVGHPGLGESQPTQPASPVQRDRTIGEYPMGGTVDPSQVGVGPRPECAIGLVPELDEHGRAAKGRYRREVIEVVTREVGSHVSQLCKVAGAVDPFKTLADTQIHFKVPIDDGLNATIRLREVVACSSVWARARENPVVAPGQAARSTAVNLGEGTVTTTAPQVRLRQIHPGVMRAYAGDARDFVEFGEIACRTRIPCIEGALVDPVDIGDAVESGTEVDFDGPLGGSGRADRQRAEDHEHEGG